MSKLAGKFLKRMECNEASEPSDPAETTEYHQNIILSINRIKRKCVSFFQENVKRMCLEKSTEEDLIGRMNEQEEAIAMKNKEIENLQTELSKIKRKNESSFSMKQMELELQQKSLEEKEKIQLAEQERNQAQYEKLKALNNEVDSLKQKFQETILVVEKSSLEALEGKERVTELEQKTNSISNLLESVTRKEEELRRMEKIDTLNKNVDERLIKEKEEHREILRLEEKVSEHASTLSNLRTQDDIKKARIQDLEEEKEELHGKNMALYQEVTELVSKAAESSRIIEKHQMSDIHSPKVGEANLVGQTAEE